jgi:prepilin-type N-terminal cleavage/methylation domain-containing protein
MNCPRRQSGFTLMETMISLALSLVVTSAMVVLMGNSLGTTTRIIQMTQLTDELRNTMSMLTRDIRRANYSAKAAYCYANSDCGLDGSANQFADIDVSDGSCVLFGLDRDWDGDAAADNAGGFRRVAAGGVGWIEMWVGDNAPNCAAINDPDWVAITDPDFVDITGFVITNNGSFDGCVEGEGGSSVTQFTRQVQVSLGGSLIRDDTITRQIDDDIKLRNDMIVKNGFPCPAI